MLRPWTIEIQLKKDATNAIYIQIADHIIGLIKNGTMKSGDALPSSRQLANEMKINRNTAIRALDILIIEGWLSSIERKGLFVAGNLPFNKENDCEQLANKETKQIVRKKTVISFDGGLPNTLIAPIKDLARAYRQIFNRKAQFNLMTDINEYGNQKLRSSISKMLNQTRGMHTDASQVCITRGSQMALFLVAHTLLNKGDLVLVENPGYKPAWDAFRHAGAELIPIAVDEKGICVHLIEKIVTETNIKAVYVTPHHQYPTTVVMSLDRRLRLIELSKQYGFMIIEDDYDSDFHFGQRSIAPLTSLTNVNSVYIGTFSKMISPSLRIGYLVAHMDVLEKVADLRRIIDLQGDNIMEQAILELIDSGILKKHIRKASKVYKNKRDYFAFLIDTYLSDKIHYKLPEGGLAFWLEPKNVQDLELLNQNLERSGVTIIKQNKYSFDKQINGIRLGYVSLSDAELEEGIKILNELIK